MEEINNRIKVIKRMVYGYRDSTFFFIKIKNDFPGNPQRTFFCRKNNASSISSNGSSADHNEN
ncbi:transposase [Pseudomonas fulva]|uniref:transposase n=1 Tax=Pseudomonas fulva TaxID=47880 RepID=UPI0022A71272|nr:transposase [Pseudomonas fulva]